MWERTPLPDLMETDGPPQRVTTGVPPRGMYKMSSTTERKDLGGPNIKCRDYFIKDDWVDTRFVS